MEEVMVPGQLHVAVSAYHQQSGGCDLSRYKLQEQQGRPIGPVQIVQDEDDRLPVSRFQQEARDGIKQPESSLVWLLKTWQWPEAWESFPDIRHNLSDSRCTATHVCT
jgi:hypothetical protein